MRRPSAASSSGFRALKIVPRARWLPPSIDVPAASRAPHGRCGRGSAALLTAARPRHVSTVKAKSLAALSAAAPLGHKGEHRGRHDKIVGAREAASLRGLEHLAAGAAIVDAGCTIIGVGVGGGREPALFLPHQAEAPRKPPRRPDADSITRSRIPAARSPRKVNPATGLWYRRSTGEMLAGANAAPI